MMWWRVNGIIWIAISLAVSSAQGMYQQIQNKVQVTVLDQSKTPDEPFIALEKSTFLMHDLIERGKRPVLLSVYNQSDAPILLTSESCRGIEFLSAADIVNCIGHNTVRKTIVFLGISSLLIAVATAALVTLVGKDIYAILRATVLARARERADKKQQQVLATGQEIAGWLSLLPIPYVATVYRVLAKRKQLLPFIKRTVPTAAKKLVAHISGRPYIDDTECKEIISELATRSSGNIVSLVYKYLQLVDVEKMARIVREKAPLASLVGLAGIGGICTTPAYAYELQRANYFLNKKLKKQLLSSKAVTIMPGETVKQIMVLPNMVVDKLDLRLFNHQGNSEIARFGITLT